MKKRLISLLIVLCMVLALVPAGVAASASNFTDVKRDAWYYDYVNEVVSEGYFRGESSTIFSPDKQMTRAMFVTVLSRVDDANVDDSRSAFDDVPVDQWYTGAVSWANRNSIVLGTGGRNFEPNRAISRIEMCLIMSRYISYYAAETGKTPVATSKAKTFSDTFNLNSESMAALEACVSYGLIEGMPDGTFKPNNTATRAEVAAVIARLAWVTTGGGSGGWDSTNNSVTYYRNYNERDDVKVTKIGQLARRVMDPEDLGFAAPEGMVFVEWNTRENGKGDAYEVGERITGSLTLYAQWEDEEPPVPDHIYEAMVDAVDYTDEQVQGLYTGAIIALKSLQSDELNKVIDAAADKTSVSVALNSRDDHQIDVTLRTDANDQNVIELAKFAYHYAMALYRGNDQEGGGQGGSGQTTADLKERIKALLDSLNIDYSGNGWSEKIQRAAQSLADLGKGKAAEYRDALKEIFKNVDASDLLHPVENGTASVEGVTVTAKGVEIFTADKDNTVINRQTLKDIAKKLHEAVQDTSTGAWQNIQELAAGIDGEITFEPADEIAEYYGTGSGLYSPVYTVNFIVETGTEEYLAYKYAGGYDHFQFAPTQAMWDQYTAKLRNLKSAVAEQMKGKAANSISAYSSNFSIYSAIASVKALARLGTPIMTMATTTADEGMSLVDMIAKLDEAFKELHNSEDDTTVQNYMDQWKEDNKDNLSKEDMIDILIGEKELDTETLNNEAIMDMLDQLVQDVATNEKVTKNVKTDKENGWDGEELRGFIEEYVNLPERVQEVLEAAEDFGLTDYVYNAMADEFNENNLEQNPDRMSDPTFKEKYDSAKAGVEAEKGKVEEVFKDAVKDQIEDPRGLEEFGKDYLEVDIDEIIKEEFGGDVNLDDLLNALDLFNELMDPDALPNKTLGGLVEAMGTDTAMGKVMSDRWDNYSGRVQSVFNRVNGLINRLLNTRYGDTVENATIQIGKGNDKIRLSDIQGLLEDTNCSDYAAFVEAITTFVNDTANIENLTINALGDTLITVEVEGYDPYSFYVEIDLSNVR